VGEQRRFHNHVSLGGGNMSASITDMTANPTLHLQETFRLDQLDWAFNICALGMHRELHTIGQMEASSVIRATAKTIQPQHADEHEHVAAAILESFKQS
jgi:hypothetical protein